MDIIRGLPWAVECTSAWIDFKIKFYALCLLRFSPKAPLYDMTGHEDKILCADWSVSEQMICGGADKHIRIFKNLGNLTEIDQ